MQIKLGDKFLCKKTNKGHDNDIGVEENKWYEVVKPDGPLKGLENLKISRYVRLNDGKSVYDFTFCITHHNDISDYIWDYFYKPKELRKKKLDEINGNK